MKFSSGKFIMHDAIWLVFGIAIGILVGAILW